MSIKPQEQKPDFLGSRAHAGVSKTVHQDGPGRAHPCAQPGVAVQGLIIDFVDAGGGGELTSRTGCSKPHHHPCRKRSECVGERRPSDATRPSPAALTRTFSPWLSLALFPPWTRGRRIGWEGGKVAKGKDLSKPRNILHPHAGQKNKQEHPSIPPRRTCRPNRIFP